MSKYRELSAHLESLETDHWEASFEEIEAILGFRLPKSARTYHAWWANQVGQGHSQSAAWQTVGWRTGELSLPDEKVCFFRTASIASTRPTDVAEAVGNDGRGLSIAEAKSGLAAYFDVREENIEIIIKG